MNNVNSSLVKRNYHFIVLIVWSEVISLQSFSTRQSIPQVLFRKCDENNVTFLCLEILEVKSQLFDDGSCTRKRRQIQVFWWIDAMEFRRNVLQIQRVAGHDFFYMVVHFLDIKRIFWIIPQKRGIEAHFDGSLWVLKSGGSIVLFLDELARVFEFDCIKNLSLVLLL